MAQYVVGSGQTSSGLVLNNGDVALVLSGGSAVSTTINSGGAQTVFAGGHVVTATVNSGGTETISSGGLAGAVNVSSGGTLNIYSGGSATSGTVVHSGATLIDGGRVILSSGTDLTNGQVSAGFAVLSSGAIAGAITLIGSTTNSATTYGDLVVLSSATATGTMVQNNGLVTVSSGGVASSVVVSSGGYLEDFASGRSVSASLVGGYAFILGGVDSSATIGANSYLEVYSGGVESGAVVLSGGTLEVGYEPASGSGYVVSGVGSASGIVVSNGGYLVVDGGSMLTGATIDSGGIIDVLGGSTVTGVVFNSGGEIFDSGTTPTSVILRSSQLASAFISSGATGTGFTVNSGTSLTISSGGIVTNTLVAAGGSEVILYTGAATSTTLQTGGTIDLQSLSYVTSGSASLNSATDVLTVTEGSVTSQVSLSGSYADEYFHLAADGVGGTLITQDANPACYCHGTLIQTDRGEVAVEALAIGDLVVTASGERRPVRWLGRRSYSGRFLRANPGVQPIRFRAGSLGDGLPRRDLLVSPNHAMLLDGVLVPAGLLVNGTSIVHERGMVRVDYVHLELDGHDVLLAEGAPSESFVDDDSRGIFHNAAAWQRENVGRAGTPAVFCAPRVEHGPALAAIRRRLQGEMGHQAKVA